jgi:hypothetical protein
MITDINNEDRLVQETFANHLRDKLGWDSVYAWNAETFGPSSTLGRDSERDTVLVRDLRDAISRLNTGLPDAAIDDILDHLYVTLPRPPFTEDETKRVATRVYDYVWQRSAAGAGFIEDADSRKRMGEGH